MLIIKSNTLIFASKNFQPPGGTTFVQLMRLIEFFFFIKWKHSAGCEVQNSKRQNKDPYTFLISFKFTRKKLKNVVNKFF